MGTIYLDSKDLKGITQGFTLASLFKSRLQGGYDFVGVKTARIHTLLSVPMVDYTRSGANRYGSPTELEDSVQELTLTRDRGFALTVDKGNNLQAGNRKEAGRVLRVQMDEKMVPEYDAYVADVLAHKAGKIFGSSTALTKSNIAERITDGNAHLDDKEVPRDGRFIAIPPKNLALLRLSPEYLANDRNAGDAVAKGRMGWFDGCEVVMVPTGRLPANVNFIIAHKSAATAPQQLSDTKIHKDPPGISGDLIEGRNIYDCFVIGAKADGIYVDVLTGSGKATICANPTLASDTLSSTTTGSSIAYTVDGTDPRYSKSAVVGTNVSAVEAGVVIKAYAYKDGCFASEVASLTQT